jgi:hypothetical protein
MRVTGLAILGLISFLAMLPAADATPALPSSARVSSDAIVRVAEGCGYGWHWVGGYRDRYGAWIPGHCARN